MTTDMETWARAERQFLRDELKWLTAGGRLTSPSGEDIKVAKIAELTARLKHAEMVLNDAGG